jgi:nicotinate-nucleotide adenylyltransferase
MSNKKHRIAVFGGTFNPPHQGHSLLAQQIIKHNFADQILFIPALRPPHKPGTPSVAFDDRFAMTSLVVDSLNQDAGKEVYVVSDIEGKGGDKPSYTYNTMVELSHLYPDDELFLLIGGDSLLNLHTWYNAEKLVENWKILTYPRNQVFDSPEEILKELRKKWSEKIASSLFQSILTFKMCDISSTKIREELNSNGDTVYSLNPSVYKYIQEQGLYKNE